MLRSRGLLPARTDRRIAMASGLFAAAADCVFLLQGLTGARLDPLNSLISELEVPGQPDSGVFRWASLAAGSAVVVQAAALSRVLPRSRAAAAGCWALAVSGAGAMTAALAPMPCVPSLNRVCEDYLGGEGGWEQVHTWASTVAVVALLASVWLLSRALTGRSGWHRVARIGRAGFWWLAAVDAAAAALTEWYVPGVGLAERLQVIADSSWLVVLSLGAAGWLRE